MRSLTQSSAGVVLVRSSFISNDDLFPSCSLVFQPLFLTIQYPTIPQQRHSLLLRPSNKSTFFKVTEDSTVVSAHAREEISQAIQSGWAESTVKRYSGTIKQFIQFCDKEWVLEHLHFPTDKFVLYAFVASSLNKHAGSTPRSHLSALKVWHFTHNIEWKGSIQLHYVLNGIRNLAPGTSKHPLRPPISMKMLAQLVDNLNLNSPLELVVAACAATAFWGQCRLGELLPTSLSTLTDSPLPTCADFKRSLRNPQSCILHLP
jgi:hypothetical protein